MSTFPFHSTLYYGPLDFNIAKEKVNVMVNIQFSGYQKVSERNMLSAVFFFTTSFLFIYIHVFFFSRSEHNILRWLPSFFMDYGRVCVGPGPYSLAVAFGVLSTGFCPPRPTRPFMPIYNLHWRSLHLYKI